MFVDPLYPRSSLRRVRTLPLCAFLLACIHLATNCSAAEPLRLIGYTAEREFTDIRSSRGKLLVAAEGETTPVPRGTRWRIEGDLAANTAYMFFAPDFQVLTRPNHPISAEQRTRTFAVVPLFERWPWEEPGNYIRAVIVVLWLVDGEPTRIIPIAANTGDGPSDSVAGLAAFELSPTERRGRPVVLLLKDGKWMSADRWFPDTDVDGAFAQLHWDENADISGMLSRAEPKALWTRLYGRPLAYMFASAGFTRGVEALVAADRHKERARSDNTALHAAVEGGYRDVASVLVAAGAKGRALNGNGRSPLGLALWGGHLDLVCDFLGENPQPDELRRALQLALELGDTQTLQRLLEAGGESHVRKLHPDDFSRTLELGDATLVQRLVKAGMRLNDERPLLHAAVSGSAPTVQMLLEAGAKVNRTAPDGTAAVILAASRGHVPVLEVLHKAGADLNAVDKSGESALSAAIAANQAAAVEFLSGHGARTRPAARRARSHDPKLRWMADYLRPDFSRVLSEFEVDLPPVVKRAPSIEVIRGSSGGVTAVTTTQYVTNAYTGQYSSQSVTHAVPSHVPSVGSDHWAVATMIVEMDGSVSHAIMVDANSGETWRAVDKILDRYEFEPGEHEGRKVRTRITLPILVPD